MRWPLDVVDIKQYFDEYSLSYPFWGFRHKGIDLGAWFGTPVKAPDSGVIVQAQNNGLWGNLVVIQHSLYLYTYLAHNESFNCRVGDFVRKGDVVASVGSTGKSSGPHSHWGVMEDNIWVNPILFLDLIEDMSYQDFIISCYKAFFNRSPSNKEIKEKVDALQAKKMSVQDLVWGFISSPEFKDKRVHIS